MFYLSKGFARHLREQREEERQLRLKARAYYLQLVGFTRSEAWQVSVFLESQMTEPLSG